LKQAFFAQNFLTIKRQSNQHLAAQRTYQQVALPLGKL
jgi:hypothetical protein